jgi:membrane protein DedA with SNARE-associated domain
MGKGCGQHNSWIKAGNGRTMLKELVHSALVFIESLGYWGILLGLMLEVIPSEVVLSFGGYLVAQGKVSIVGAIFFGTLGCVIQQIFLYWIGRYGGRPFVDKFGKYLLLKPRFIDMASEWFNKYGPIMVFAARFVPVVRQAISIPAGMARMPMGQFLFYTTLGTIPWAIIFVYFGKSLGENWEQIEEVAGPLLNKFIAAAVIVIALYIIWKLLRKKK